MSCCEIGFYYEFLESHIATDSFIIQSPKGKVLESEPQSTIFKEESVEIKSNDFFLVSAIFIFVIASVAKLHDKLDLLNTQSPKIE